MGLRYRQFLLEPGSLVTIATSLLLVLAFIRNPSRLIGGTEQGSSLLYLASALVGSAYIRWSAIQGIRERDFTADIPVSLATMGAIAIGESMRRPRWWRSSCLSAAYWRASSRRAPVTRWKPSRTFSPTA